MICVLTYFDSILHMSRSRDLRSKFDLHLLGSKLEYFDVPKLKCFDVLTDVPRRDEQAGVRIIVLALFIKKLGICKKELKPISGH